MKKMLLFAVLVSVIFISGCVQEAEQPIGGERDEYGCLVSASYSYNEKLALCARPWEIVSDDQIQAIRKASESMTDRYGLTIVEYSTLDCEGCFVIRFNNIEEQTEVRLENWEIIE